MKIAEYKFYSSTDTLPTFNSGFEYTHTDIDNGDGTITRTIESDSLPTKINFYNSNVITINYLNTSELTEMQDMFNSCRSLVSVNTTDWDTSKVTTMQGLFNSCVLLSEIDASSLDTSNVTDMGYMFSNCRNLTSLDLSSFDTSNVTDMQYMFYDCKKLTSLDVSNFDTSNVTNMDYMFNGCAVLTSLDLNNFDSQNVSSMSYMVANCYKITSLDVSNWNTSSVTNMQCMFLNCHELTSLDISNFDTGNVTNMRQMFNNCYELTSLDLSNWDTSNVTNMSAMFNYCANLISLDLSNFDTSNVTDMQQMFNYCFTLTELDLSNFDTSNVTNMLAMFWDCSNLTTLDISNFNLKNITVDTSTGIFNSINKISHIGMLYCDKETCEKVQSLLPNVNNLQRTIWVQDTDEKDYISNEYVVIKEYGFEKQKIRLPQSLRGIQGNADYGTSIDENVIDCNKFYSDRLYWDNAKGRYCIEQNIIKITAEDIINDVYAELYTQYHPNYAQDYVNGQLVSFMVQNIDLFYSADYFPVYNNLFPDINNGDVECIQTRHEGILHIFIKPERLNIDFSTTPGIAEVINAMKEWLATSNLVMYAIRRPNIIETDITEKIALNTYNPYMKIFTNEEEIEPTNMVVRFPYKDYFNDDVTVNILTSNYSPTEEFGIDTYLDLNRGDYIEAEFSWDTYPTDNKYYAFIIVADKNLQHSVEIGVCMENEPYNFYAWSSTHNYEYTFYSSNESIDKIKFKFDKNGIALDDYYIDFIFSDNDCFAEAFDFFRNNNVFVTGNRGDTSSLGFTYSYIRTIQQQPSEELGHLNNYNHYYQNYTNHPLEVENNNLCEIHDSYISEIYGQTLKESTDPTMSTNPLDFIGEPYMVYSRYQTLAFRNTPTNVGDIIYFKLNFTLNTYNAPDGVGGVYSTRYGGGYNYHHYALKKSDIGKNITASIRRKVETDFCGGIVCYLGLLGELPEGFLYGDDLFTFTLNNYVCYNLTQTFGSGNEPTQEWCDENLLYINPSEIISFNEDNKLKLRISNCPVKFGGDK